MILYLLSLCFSVPALIFVVVVALNDIKLPLWKLVGYTELYVFIGISAILLILGIISEIEKERELNEDN